MLKALKNVEEKLEVLVQMSPANFRILPVPDDFQSSLRDGTWSKKVKAHYQVDYCTVLSQLFPQSDLSYWFPAVSEHIVPKGQWQFAKGLGFEVSHSRNGLLLLKHLEKTYQAGKWTLIPTGNHANGVKTDRVWRWESSLWETRRQRQTETPHIWRPARKNHLCAPTSLHVLLVSQSADGSWRIWGVAKSMALRRELRKAVWCNERRTFSETIALTARPGSPCCTVKSQSRPLEKEQLLLQFPHVASPKNAVTGVAPLIKGVIISWL